MYSVKIRVLQIYFALENAACNALTAMALNELLGICETFASQNQIEFSPTKTVVLLVSPVRSSFKKTPNIYLKDIVMSYVDDFKSLGHIINNDLTDDKDIERERRSLATKLNLIAHKFHFRSDDVNIVLFKCYYYQLYGC